MLMASFHVTARKCIKLANLGVNKRIILKQILKEIKLNVRTGYCLVAGSCGHGNKPSGSTKWMDIQYLNSLATISI
jgi:hypothetical protein